jgi:hypothetical protein
MSSQFEEAFRDLVKDVLHDVDEVEADNIRGLSDFVSEAIGEETFDVDRIEGLDRYVKDEVDDCLKDKLKDAVNEEVDDIIDEKILTGLKEHGNIRKVVKEIVKEYIKEFIGRVIAVE